MPVSPPDEALRDILTALRAQNPTLGISKLHTKLLLDHPDWTVSEKRIKKVLAQASQPGPAPRPTSRVIDNLNVSRWTSKIKVVDYGKLKGKGLEAIAEIKEGEDVWKEDPFVISPGWDIYDLQVASHACLHCTTPFNASTLSTSVSCPSSTNAALPTAGACPARFCNRLCLTRAMSRQHPLLCPALNPASVPLISFVRSRSWMAVYAVAQCIARFLMAHEQGRKQDLEEDLRFIQSLAQMNTEERWKIFDPSGRKPDYETWKAAHTLVVQAFRDPPNPRDKKQLSKVLRKPLPEDLSKLLFDYDSFLRLLTSMGLNLEGHGGLYILHSHLNHSCDPNISVRHFEQKTALSRITMRARRDIHPGEELTVAYVNPALPLHARRRALSTWAFGTCMCEKCAQEEKEEKEKKKVEGENGNAEGEEAENEKFSGLEQELKQGLGLLLDLFGIGINSLLINAIACYPNDMIYTVTEDFCPFLPRKHLRGSNSNSTVASYGTNITEWVAYFPSTLAFYAFVRGLRPLRNLRSKRLVFVVEMGFDPTKALAGVDLSNKVILVTGSTSGIGFATAQVLVQRGAKVYLAARNADKAAACIKRIEESLPAASDETKKGQALFHQLDLSDPKDAKTSAQVFLEKEQRLDVLINCAAVILEDFQIGVNGISNIMNVNYFSVFVWTDTLLPLLKKTAAEPDSDVRIVNVSSDGHKQVSGVRFKSKEDFNRNWGNSFMQSLKRYDLSKLADALWSRELQRRLSEEGINIIVLTIMPGVVYTEACDTAGDRFVWPVSSFLKGFARLTFMKVLDGAGTPVLAAVSPKIRAEADKYKGAYLRPIGKLDKFGKEAQKDELASELWTTTEQLLKEWNI